MPQIKIESVLACRLMQEGYRPYVATFKPRQLVHGYHRTFGIRDFVSPDKYVTRAIRRMAAAATDEFLSGPRSFRDVMDFKYHGAQVGRHVLSSIISNRRSGSLEFADPAVSHMLREGLQKAIRYVHAADRLLDVVQPDLVLLLERGIVPFGEFFDAALNRGIPVIQYCHPHRKDALLLKRYTPATRNHHPWSLSAESWKQARRMPWSAAIEDDLMTELRGRYESGTWFDRKFLQVGKSLKTPEQVRQQLELDPARKTAVVFSHVLWDATFFYGTSLFDDYEQWLVETVKAACANPRVNWVIKLHPDYLWKMKMAGDTGRPPEYAALEQKVGPLPRHIRILPPQTDISTWSLFGVTDWCLTVRGTIGIEMSCFGIPVLTAGTGRYSGLGFTVDSTTREEYLERVRRIDAVAPMDEAQVQLARRHAFAALRLRPIPFHSFEMVQDDFDSLGHALDHNVVIRVRVVGRAAPRRRSRSVCPVGGLYA
jgi:hypothetical protein